MSEMERPRVKVGISVGDVNGIGLEVVMKALQDNRILDDITPVIYASSKLISFHKKALDLEFNFTAISSADEAMSKKINVVSPWEEEFTITIGERNEETGKYALKSLEAATKDLASNKVDVLVTAPIDKKLIQGDGFDFPGHTEYLAKMAGVDEALMLMVSGGLRVGVVTGHIPLAEVPKAISKEKIIAKAEQLEQSLIKDFDIRRPKIAILGLNPHAGEKGMLGEEDESIILPAISNLQGQNKLVYGPFPADGFFGSSTFMKYDGVLAMYHDQGLIPFKALSFNNGVNYTAGLPIVRTSPDHGTGFDIAGKNLANENSLRQAIYVARDVYLNRQMHKEISANPLQPQKMD